MYETDYEELRDLAMEYYDPDVLSGNKSSASNYIIQSMCYDNMQLQTRDDDDALYRS